VAARIGIQYASFKVHIRPFAVDQEAVWPNWLNIPLLGKNAKNIFGPMPVCVSLSTHIHTPYIKPLYKTALLCFSHEERLTP
jgi:hypothetical protein